MVNGVLTEAYNTLLELIEDEYIENKEYLNEPGEFPHHNFEQLKKNGLLTYFFPKNLGGGGGNWLEFKQWVVQLALICPSTALCFIQHCSGLNVLKEGADNEYIKSVIDDIVSHQKLVTIAFSELSTGANLLRSTNKVQVLDGGGYEIQNVKPYVTSAHAADYLILSAIHPSHGNIEKTAFFCVDMKDKNIQVTGCWDTLGMRSSDTYQINFNRCRLHSDSLINPSKDSVWIAANSIIPTSQIGLASLNFGIAKGFYDETVKRVKSRHLLYLNKSLAELATIQQRIAEMKVILDTLEAAIDRVCLLVDSEDYQIDRISDVLQLKIQSCQSIEMMESKCLATIGIQAYQRGHRVEQCLRDSKAGVLMGPTPDIIKEIVGKIVLQGGG